MPSFLSHDWPLGYPKLLPYTLSQAQPQAAFLGLRCSALGQAWSESIPPISPKPLFQALRAWAQAQARTLALAHVVTLAVHPIRPSFPSPGFTLMMRWA